MTRQQIKRFPSLQVKGDYLYFGLSFFLLLFYFFQVITEHWTGDFFEHTAVIRELATNPFSPQHPTLSLTAPHAFYSPYAFCLAMVSRLLNMGPMTTLALAGLFNLLLFLVSLRAFVKFYFCNRAHSQHDYNDNSQTNEFAPFYMLLFTLFLWGVSPWNWSGFFHIGALMDVAPYPSTLAFALVLISFILCGKISYEGQFVYVLPVALIAAIVLIMHPLTALFMYIGMLAFAIDTPIANRPKVAITATAVIVASLLMAFLWPYFSIISLIAEDSAIFDATCYSLYDSIVIRILPALVGVPLLIARYRDNKTDPFLIMGFMFTAVYFYGAVSGSYNFGRSISHVVFILHLVLADYAGRNYPIRWPSAWADIKTKVAIITALFLIGGQLLLPVGELVLKPSIAKQYKALSSLTGQYDVIISDMKNDMVVSALGGKTVTTTRPAPFVQGYDERKNSISRFFDESTSHAERRIILKKYSVKYLLLSKDASYYSASQINSFVRLGDIRHLEKNFILIGIKI